MSEPFLGEIKIVAFDFAPRGWAGCNGQLLPINQNQALFSLLGTAFGGDGVTTFALPDFRGHLPMNAGQQHLQGERGGEETHTLTISEMPTHIHLLNADADMAASNTPENNLLAASPREVYGRSEALVPMAADTVGVTGAALPHDNMKPFLVLNFVIALQGIFPSRD